MNWILILSLAGASMLTTTGCVFQSESADNAEQISVDWLDDQLSTECPSHSTTEVIVRNLADDDLDNIVVYAPCQDGEVRIDELDTPADFEVTVHIYGPELVKEDDEDEDGVRDFSDAYWLGGYGLREFPEFSRDTFVVPVTFEYGFFEVTWTIDGLEPDASLCDDPAEPIDDVEWNADLVLDRGGTLVASFDFDCTDGDDDGALTDEMELGEYDITLEVFEPNGESLGESRVIKKTLDSHEEVVKIGPIDIQLGSSIHEWLGDLFPESSVVKDIQR